ncbi:hypothetical protein V8E54_006648 [Elaphomyces granulatus]
MHMDGQVGHRTCHVGKAMNEKRHQVPPKNGGLSSDLQVYLILTIHSSSHSAGSSASATNVTTDVSTEPSILQIQDNGNDPEEEGGDDFVDIDDMLLDELEVYRQHG